MMARSNYVNLAVMVVLLCACFLLFRWLDPLGNEAVRSRLGLDEEPAKAEPSRDESVQAETELEGVREQLRALRVESEGKAAELVGVREQLRGLRSLLEEMSCKSQKIGARGGFCLSPENINVGWNIDWDRQLCAHAEEGLLKGQEVVDFGAGLGWYGMYWTRKTSPFFRYGKEVEMLHFFNDTGVKERMKMPMMLKAYEGYDGAGNVELVTNGFIKYLDLSEKQDLGRKFDWVFSLEVGEHIPAPFETVFIENLIRHACKGVLLSWAIEGQEGHFHVNNRNNDYIKKVFEGYGFVNLLEEENKLRGGMSYAHLTRTFMAFQRKEILNDSKCPKHNP